MSESSEDRLRRERGRRVARFKKLIGQLERPRCPDPDYVSGLLLETVSELIVFERLLEMDPVERAATDPASVTVTREEVLARLRLMTPAAGLEVPS